MATACLSTRCCALFEPHERAFGGRCLPPCKTADRDGRALVAREGVFVLSRKAGRVEVRKFERLAEGGQPRQTPGSHSLDSETDLPMVAGKALFICTNTGAVYAHSLKTLDKLWTYQTNKGSPPSQMSVSGDLLYLAFPTGDLMVLSGK